MVDSSNSIGVGLYLGKQICQKYGGDLDFVSQKNEGTTFVFTQELLVLEEEIPNSARQNAM